ncbi:hypothetical protein GWL_40080 [Herbaspirillum sp. GW103]|nr:hypothetical protein GWL_40080 [Herbaspirillum sp. GW103]
MQNCIGPGGVAPDTPRSGRIPFEYGDDDRLTMPRQAALSRQMEQYSFP